MITFTDSYSLRDDTLDDGERLGINQGRSRQFIRSMVEDGAYGIEIVYAMTFAAVEAGLIQIDNGFYIFPRIAQAIADAGFQAQKKAQQAAGEEAALIDDPLSNIVPLANSLNVGGEK